MDYLIDAHALIWHAQGDPRLSLPARAVLTGETGIPVLSDVTFWEISLKHSLGKLQLGGGPEKLRKDWIEENAARSLSIAWPHILRSGKLAHIHGDPFDRMLIAQALEEDLTIVTCDENIRKYPDLQTLW